MMQSRKWLLAGLAGLTLSVAPLMVSAQKTSAPTMTTTKVIALVNVNTAATSELETLPGIGPKLAAEIIKNRPYKSGKDLQTKVKGIGQVIWNEIKQHVKFK